jgi:hypothetical protein
VNVIIQKESGNMRSVWNLHMNWILVKKGCSTYQLILELIYEILSDEQHIYMVGMGLWH